MDDIKEIVTTMKTKGLMRQFSENYRAIPREIETRFNSTYNSLKVFVKQYKNLKEFTKRDKELPVNIISVKEEVIEKVLPLLEVFNTSTLILPQNSAPTIQLVIQIKRRVLSNLEIDKNEGKTVQTFKNIMKSNVEKCLKIHFIHKFALDFDLKIKDLKYLSENDKKEVLEVMKENMKSFSTRVQIESNFATQRTS